MKFISLSYEFSCVIHRWISVPGVRLVHRLVETTEIPDLLAIVKDNLVYRLNGYFLGTTSLDAFGLDTLDYRHVRGRDERGFKQHRRDPLPFRETRQWI